MAHYLDRVREDYTEPECAGFGEVAYILYNDTI